MGLCVGRARTRTHTRSESMPAAERVSTTLLAWVRKGAARRLSLSPTTHATSLGTRMRRGADIRSSLRALTSRPRPSRSNPSRQPALFQSANGGEFGRAGFRREPQADRRTTSDQLFL